MEADRFENSAMRVEVMRLKNKLNNGGLVRRLSNYRRIMHVII